MMTDTVKTAVIMAAGMGTRFGKQTESMPKGFIPVCGIPMIIRSIDTLLACGIEKIILGTGFHSEKFEALKQYYPQIQTCFSKHYATTNSLWTLCNCRQMIGDDDFLLLESDIIYEKRAISELLLDQHSDILLAAQETKFQDQYFVEYDANNHLTNCSTTREDLNSRGEFVGVHKLSSTFYKSLCAYYERIKHIQPKLGYEFGLLFVSRNIIPLYVYKIDGLKWYEIDDENDLNDVRNIYGL